MAELDPVLNFRTLTDYDVKRFFEQVFSSADIFNGRLRMFVSK